MTERNALRPAVAVLALLLLVLAAMPALAQQPADAEEMDRRLAAWRADLDRIETSLARPAIEDQALVRLREELEHMRRDVAGLIGDTRQRLNAVRSQLDALGPPPGPEDPPEPDAAAAERKRLTNLATILDGAMRAAEVVQTRARQHSDLVQERRRTLFSAQLLARVASPLTARLWRQIGNDVTAGAISLRRLIDTWWREVANPAWLLGPLVLALLVWGGLKAASVRAIDRYRSNPTGEPPPFLRRAASAPGVALARALPPIAAAAGLYATLLGLELLPGRMQALAWGALMAIVAAAALIALVNTVLSTRWSEWRIFPANDASAMRLRWLASAMAAVYGLDVFLSEMNRIIIAPLYLTVAQNLFTTLGLMALLVAILRTPIGWDPHPEDEERRPEDSALEEPASSEMPAPARTAIQTGLWIFVATVLVTTLLGYIALGRFLAAQVVTTGSLLILLYLLHIAIEELANGIADPETRVGRWIGTRMALPQERGEQAGLVVSLLLHAVLILAAVPLLMVQWGFDWEDVRSGLAQAFFGFEFGTWQISLATVLGAILVFIIGLVATRLFQRWLDTGVMQRARFEAGARSAIGTVVGYAGVTLAALFALSYTGFDLSTIAIVAGALGVGIGFGLQSIVNNFVSGLILLAERRIGVGDWIVVGEEEGHVRRISVRATEIETFDRNYVIIPNADLIANTVKNWTFRHRRARLMLVVGVSYDSDPQQVADILVACAEAHPDVIDNPAPRVMFDDFGDNALMFRLICFVSEVDKLFVTRSELRFAILKCFREGGVEIPFPQRDLHLKDIARIEKALSGANSGGRAARKPPARGPREA